MSKSLILIMLVILGHSNASGASGDSASSTSVALFGDPWIDQFLDKMYLGPRISPKAENHDVDLFEAQIAPHLFVFNFSRCALDPHDRPWLPRGIALVFEPLVRLRMTQSDSAPVRTPSYNPQMTGQVFWTWGYPDDAEGKALAAGLRPDHWVGLLSLQYTFAHHSNGQQGCTFKDTGILDPKCSHADFSQGIPEINTQNGNYGTNYETVGLFHKWFHLTQLQEDRAISVGVTWERYSYGVVQYLPGALGDTSPGDQDFRTIFGNHRFSLIAEFEGETKWAVFPIVRATINATAISPAIHVGWQGRLMSDISAFFPGKSGIGLFARLFYGYDYYNIRLRDLAPMAVLGVTWDTRDLQSFRAPQVGTTERLVEPAPVTSGTVSPPVGPSKHTEEH